MENLKRPRDENDENAPPVQPPKKKKGKRSKFNFSVQAEEDDTMKDIDVSNLTVATPAPKAAPPVLGESTKINTNDVVGNILRKKAVVPMKIEEVVQKEEKAVALQAAVEKPKEEVPIQKKEEPTIEKK